MLSFTIKTATKYRNFDVILTFRDSTNAKGCSGEVLMCKCLLQYHYCYCVMSQVIKDTRLHVGQTVGAALKVKQ